MLSERPWKLEAVLALLAGLVVGWSALNLSAIGVTQLALHKNSPNRLIEFVISSFSFIFSCGFTARPGTTSLVSERCAGNQLQQPLLPQ